MSNSIHNNLNKYNKSDDIQSNEIHKYPDEPSQYQQNPTFSEPKDINSSSNDIEIDDPSRKALNYPSSSLTPPRANSSTKIDSNISITGKEDSSSSPSRSDSKTPTRPSSIVTSTLARPYSSSVSDTITPALGSNSTISNTNIISQGSTPSVEIQRMVTAPSGFEPDEVVSNPLNDESSGLSNTASTSNIYTSKTKQKSNPVLLTPIKSAASSRKKSSVSLSSLSNLSDGTSSSSSVSSNNPGQRQISSRVDPGQGHATTNASLNTYSTALLPPSNTTNEHRYSFSKFSPRRMLAEDSAPGTNRKNSNSSSFSPRPSRYSQYNKTRDRRHSCGLQNGSLAEVHPTQRRNSSSTFRRRDSSGMKGFDRFETIDNSSAIEKDTAENLFTSTNDSNFLHRLSSHRSSSLIKPDVVSSNETIESTHKNTAGTGYGWPSITENTRKNQKHNVILQTSSWESLQKWLYRISLLFLLLIFSAVVAAMPIDMIIQSQKTGQFWNAIIIIAAYALMGFISAIITIFRIISTRKSLAAIPHRYIPGIADVPIELYKHIQRELQRCREIARKARPIYRNPPLRISHDGLMPPSVKLRGRLADTPYIEVIKLASQTIGTKAQVLHPSFERPPGMSLRDYIYMLCKYDVIGVSKSLADNFIDQYEQARFSGKLITEAQFSDFMESCHKIMVSMKYRDVTSLSVSSKALSRYPSTRYYHNSAGQQIFQPSSPVRTSNNSVSNSNNTPNLNLYQGQMLSVPLLRPPPSAPSSVYKLGDLALESCYGGESGEENRLIPLDTTVSGVSTVDSVVYIPTQLNSNPVTNDSKAFKETDCHEDNNQNLNTPPLHNYEKVEEPQDHNPILQFRDPWVSKPQTSNQQNAPPLSVPANRVKTSSTVSEAKSTAYSPDENSQRNKSISTTFNLSTNIRTSSSAENETFHNFNSLEWNPAYESSQQVFTDSMTELTREHLARRATNNSLISVHSTHSNYSNNSTGSKIIHKVNNPMDVNKTNEQGQNKQYLTPLTGLVAQFPQIHVVHSNRSEPSELIEEQNQILQLQQMQQQLRNFKNPVVPSLPTKIASSHEEPSTELHRKKSRRTPSFHFPYIQTHHTSQSQSSSSSVIIHAAKNDSPNGLQAAYTNNSRNNSEYLPRLMLTSVPTLPQKPSKSYQEFPQPPGPSFSNNNSNILVNSDNVSNPGMQISFPGSNNIGTLPPIPGIPISLNEKVSMPNVLVGVTAPNTSSATVAAAAAAEYSTVFKTASEMVPKDSFFQTRPLSQDPQVWPGYQEQGSLASNENIPQAYDPSLVQVSNYNSNTALGYDISGGSLGPSLEPETSAISPNNSNNIANEPVNYQPSYLYGSSLPSSSSSLAAGESAQADMGPDSVGTILRPVESSSSVVHRFTSRSNMNNFLPATMGSSSDMHQTSHVFSPITLMSPSFHKNRAQGNASVDRGDVNSSVESSYNSSRLNSREFGFNKTDAKEERRNKTSYLNDTEQANQPDNFGYKYSLKKPPTADSKYEARNEQDSEYPIFYAESSFRHDKAFSKESDNKKAVQQASRNAENNSFQTQLPGTTGGNSPKTNFFEQDKANKNNLGNNEHLESELKIEKPKARQKVSSKFRVYSFNKSSKAPSTLSTLQSAENPRRTRSLEVSRDSDTQSSKDFGGTRSRSPGASSSHSGGSSGNKGPKGISSKSYLAHHHLPLFSLRRSGSGNSSHSNTATSSSTPFKASRLSEVMTRNDTREDEVESEGSAGSSGSRVGSDTGSVIIHR